MSRDRYSLSFTAASLYINPSIDADKLYPATNCGMAPLSREVARGKLKALGVGAAIVRKELAA